MDTNSIKRLQNWYISMCNGEWEHTYGIKIDTLDNPGWWVIIDLSETPLEHVPFKEYEVTDGQEWIHCFVKENKFTATSSPNKLDHIFSIFLDWAEANRQDN